MNGGDIADLESGTETEEMAGDVELAIMDEEVGECVATDVAGCAGSTSA